MIIPAKINLRFLVLTLLASFILSNSITIIFAQAQEIISVTCPSGSIPVYDPSLADVIKGAAREAIKFIVLPPPLGKVFSFFSSTVGDVASSPVEIKGNPKSCIKEVSSSKDCDKRKGEVFFGAGEKPICYVAPSKVERAPTLQCPQGSTKNPTGSNSFECIVSPISVNRDSSGKIISMQCPGLAKISKGDNGEPTGCIVDPILVSSNGDIVQPKVSGTVKPYELSVSIPCDPRIAGGTCPTTETPAGYVARLYQFGLMIAGLAAFGSIIFGSVKYILSAGSITNQQDAKDQITQAILGLVLLLGAFIILYTINPDLVNLRNPDAEIISIENNNPGADQNTSQEQSPAQGGEVINPEVGEACADSYKIGIIINGESKSKIWCKTCSTGYSKKEGDDVCTRIEERATGGGSSGRLIPIE